MSDDDKVDTSICTDPGKQQSNLFSSIGWSLVDLTGMGSLFNQNNSLQNLQNETAQENQHTQTIVNQGNLKFDNKQEQIDETLFKNITFVNNSLQSYVRLHDEILNEKITTNKLYLGASFILILIIIIFIVFTR